MATFIKQIIVSSGLITGATAAQVDLSADVTGSLPAASVSGLTEAAQDAVAAAIAAGTHTGITVTYADGSDAISLAVLYGTSSTTACVGNDSRLSDARTPTGHHTSHESGGTDAIKLDDLAAPDDNTDLNASTSAHGLLRKLDNNSAHYLDGTGAWSTPAGTYDDEAAQDAVNALLNAGSHTGITATYSDVGNSLSLAVLYGSTSTTACVGNDSRLSDSRAPSGSAGGDLTGTYPSPTIGSGKVTLAKIANAGASSRLVGSGSSGSGAAYSELTLGNGLSMGASSLAVSFGSSSSTACVGNDSRLSDARTPVGTSLLSGKVWVGDGSNLAAAATVSGSGATITLGATGVLTISAIANASLANSSVTVNGTSISLGASGTVTAAAGTLTGTTLASGVTASSLTSVGTIIAGVWQGTGIPIAYGGTSSDSASGARATLGVHGVNPAIVTYCGGL